MVRFLPPRRLAALAPLALAPLLALLPCAPGSVGTARAQETPPEREPPSGQEPPPAAEFGEEVQVTEVFLDVVAVDRKGNVVPGLGAEDFVVRRDGEPMEITSVAFYTSRYEDLEHASGPRPHSAAGAAEEDGPAAETAASQVPSARYFILFFHDQSGAVTNQSLLTRNTLDAARYARRWVKDEMQPSDWVAVVRFEQSFDLLLDFSQDPDLLESAIEAAVTDRRTGRTRPSERRRREASGGPSLLRGLPGSFELPTAAERAYDAVRMVAEASGHIVGRKNLLLFSLGFGQLDSAFRSPDSRYYPPMEEALNANNVAVYPIDLAGPSVDIPNTAFLSQLADDTGGELFKTFHSYGEPFRRISGQTTGYYLITVRAEHPTGASGYQKIEVEARPRGVQVRARKGYRYGEG